MPHLSKKTREAFRDKMGLELHPEVYIGLWDKGTKREWTSKVKQTGSRQPLGKAACLSILPLFLSFRQWYEMEAAASSHGSERLRAAWRSRNVYLDFPRPLPFLLQPVSNFAFVF